MLQKTSNLGICEKRELPDFILGVTVRLSKYPILIEAIFKSTKGQSLHMTDYDCYRFTTLVEGMFKNTERSSFQGR